VVRVDDERFHGLRFCIKHPTIGSASSADHHNEDNKRAGTGASATSISLSTWLFGWRVGGSIEAA
jgi:hypothetical protein